jgi:hypothetical protein
VKRPTLLYILSPSYSGSTLLTYLLARHPQIATIGELKATNMGDVKAYTCSCGKALTACPFWRSVTDLCKQRGIPFSLDSFGTALTSSRWLTDRLLRARVRGRAFESLRSIAFRLPGVRTETAALLKQNFDLSQVLCSVQERDIFLDGSKDAPRLLLFLKSGLWNVRTIFLTRDGRGVVNSFRTRREFDIQTAVSRWRRTMTEALNVRNRLGPHEVIDVRYEELCRQPSEVLAVIWNWLGVPGVAPTQNFRTGDYHILGNDMRLSQVTEIRLDERWRKNLGPSELQYFDAHAGSLNHALGYR